MNHPEPLPTACDTSVLVPAVIGWHPSHSECLRALDDVTHVPAHILVETFSVLTRLPAPHRLSARDAAEIVGGLAFTPIALDAADIATLVADLGRQEVRGGSAYDAVVAATALHHGCLLRTRDRRAAPTYDKIGVNYRFVGP